MTQDPQGVLPLLRVPEGPHTFWAVRQQAVVGTTETRRGFEIKAQRGSLQKEF